MTARRIDNIDTYMDSISGYSRITVERENELAAIIHGDDAEAADAAADELVCSNLRLVVKIAHDFSRFQLGFADLVSEGNIGLMKAARKFDPSKGAKFSVYAGWWIKQAMRKAIADKTRVIRLPTEQAKRKVALERYRSTWRSTHNGEEPTDEELSRVSGVSITHIDMLNKSVTETVSMDELVSEGDTTSFGDILSIEDGSELTRCREMRSAGLAQAMSELSDRDRLIVDMRFGLSGSQYSYMGIAQEIGWPPRQVSARMSELLVLLRQRLIVLGIS